MARKNLKKAQKNLSRWQDNVQDTVAPAWARTQATLQTGLDVAQTSLDKNSKIAKKKLKRAQKNFKKMQSNVQDNVGSSLSTAQDMLSKGSQQASQQIKKVTATAKNISGDLQDQYARNVRKRKRAKALFRWGLVAGIVLTLLFTPLAGSEARQRIATQWSQLRSYLGM